MTSETAVVLFLDILGFASLTEQHPDPFVTTKDERFTSTSMTPSSTRFNAFHNILDRYAAIESMYGADRMMIFSDSAFLVFPNALIAALDSVELMRKFILKGVPVRMGLAQGTCHIVRLNTF